MFLETANRKERATISREFSKLNNSNELEYFRTKESLSRTPVGEEQVKSNDWLSKIFRSSFWPSDFRSPSEHTTLFCTWEKFTHPTSLIMQWMFPISRFKMIKYNFDCLTGYSCFLWFKNQRKSVKILLFRLVTIKYLREECWRSVTGDTYFFLQ